MHVSVYAHTRPCGSLWGRRRTGDRLGRESPAVTTSCWTNLPSEMEREETASGPSGHVPLDSLG